VPGGSRAGIARVMMHSKRQCGLRDLAEQIRRQTLSGRPWGSRVCVKDLELRLGRINISPPMGRPSKASTREGLMVEAGENRCMIYTKIASKPFASCIK